LAAAGPRLGRGHVITHRGDVRGADRQRSVARGAAEGAARRTRLMTTYEAVIGLEIHIQLNTQSKVFCTCPADSWGQPPNTNICPVCTGQPGVLPVLNEAVVAKAVRLAAAVHCQNIQAQSFFDRKNYFYPDLPKGYQITQ